MWKSLCTRFANRTILSNTEPKKKKRNGSYETQIKSENLLLQLTACT